MKKSIVFCFLIGSLAAFGQKSTSFQVPSLIKKAFSEEYPTASEIYWKPYFKTYQASFYNLRDGAYYSTRTWFNADGDWLKTVETIDSKELPDAIRSYIKEFHANETIGMFSRITRPQGTPDFSIVMGDFDNTRSILFDESGRVIDIDYAPTRDW